MSDESCLPPRRTLLSVISRLSFFNPAELRSQKQCQRRTNTDPYALSNARSKRARLVVDAVQKNLLTPVGLRTLGPKDSAYQSRFEGGISERDAAYHQGTVWPWLLGPFVTAYLYACGESEQTLSFCRAILNQFDPELAACCLGSLSEVYDADPPHRPSGCPAQLWSISQLIIARHRLG
ncbi:MAG: amylo-alpha-1,6-glucosidase [Bryobacteraceae bacterium]